MDIHIHHLTKTFGSIRANNDITLHFAAGHIHGIIGENGAGKSTLMKLLSGFLKRDAGEIVLDGKPTNFSSPGAALKAGIGMVYQEPLDVPAFTALENFSCASPRKALPNQKIAREKLNRFASDLGFSVEPDAQVTHLTIGQRQQLEIMRLLACGASTLILDEPTTGITAAQKDALFAALQKLADEGKTILFVSHKLDEIDELCNTASVLRAGCVIGEGQMVLPQPRDHVLELMFGGNQHKPTVSMPLQSFVSSLPHPVWRLDQVSISRGSLTLRNISLDIRAGMVLGLAGLDGSGQQLLLRMLSGQLQPDTGQVLLNGHDMSGKPLQAFQQDGVQYLPADRMDEGLIGAFSLSEHIALINTGSVLLKKQREAYAEAQEAIDEFDIRATPSTPTQALSGGNQQRVMLSLLPQRCTGLLLEQPTRGLDVTSAWGIWQRLQARCADGMALVFTSADLDEILEYSDDVMVFCGGRVSVPIPRTQLDSKQLAALIGGVGFAAYEQG